MLARLSEGVLPLPPEPRDHFGGAARPSTHRQAARETSASLRAEPAGDCRR